MDRKATANETLKIQQQGYYKINEKTIDISEQQKQSEENSFLITAEESQRMVKEQTPPKIGDFAEYTVTNQSAVKAILDMSEKNFAPAILNFASAKNPGGGFLNGAMAQEEALAASSGLYNTLLKNEKYYSANRACGTMIYTEHAIYSTDVVFFRDERFKLIEKPILASVLTLPAVNMGQVILKGEDIEEAKIAMKNRMRLALSIFAANNNKHLILGAYGCGVFRNSPDDIALWWKQLLEDEGYGRLFSQVVFAVLDTSKKQNNISIFKKMFGGVKNESECTKGT